MTMRLLALALAVTAGACGARGGVPLPFPGAAVPPGADASPAGGAATVPERPDDAAALSRPSADLVRTALALTGVPYRNGGSDPAGFDCSGFVQYVFGRHGVALPREAREQYTAGQRIALDEVQPGDLVFFETVSRGASHVGVAIGGGRFVHAPSTRGVVRVEPYTAAYWADRFVGARRVTADP